MSSPHIAIIYEKYLPPFEIESLFAIFATNKSELQLRKPA